MPLQPSDRRFVDEFFAAIGPCEQAFQNVGLSYLALLSGDRFVITQGRVFLDTGPGKPAQQFQSTNVRAGHVYLSELKLNPRTLIERLVAEKLATPQGDLHFIAAEGGRYAASFVPFHPEGLQTQRRFNVLTIVGGQKEALRQPDIDWEIKAASTPYDGLQELANDLGLGPLTGGTATVEIVAFNVAAIDAEKSGVLGTRANLHVLLGKRLSQEEVRIGYRVYVPGTPTVRQTLLGDAMQWTEEVDFYRGQASIEVPSAAVVNCAVSYAGMTQSHYWLTDPERVQNPRRAVFETFDPKLENLKAIIANAQGRGQDARDLEAAVAWLLWMLGFNVAHLGGTRRTREAADLVVTTPAGHFAVVECTTGILKAENKLSLLHDRAEAVRRSLAASNNAYLRVLPIIVTSKGLAEIKPDVEAAEKLSILVLTREGLEQGINRSLVQPNADQMYTEGEQAVSTALTKYQNQGTLALNDNQPHQSS
jgi:hypothetical protein